MSVRAYGERAKMSQMHGEGKHRQGKQPGDLRIGKRANVDVIVKTRPDKHALTQNPEPSTHVRESSYILFEMGRDI